MTKGIAFTVSIYAEKFKSIYFEAKKLLRLSFESGSLWLGSSTECPRKLFGKQILVD